jgi:hypothetical protein
MDWIYTLSLMTMTMMMLLLHRELEINQCAVDRWDTYVYDLQILARTGSYVLLSCHDY